MPRQRTLNTAAHLTSGILQGYSQGLQFLQQSRYYDELAQSRKLREQYRQDSLDISRTRLQLAEEAGERSERLTTARITALDRRGEPGLFDPTSSQLGLSQKQVGLRNLDLAKVPEEMITQTDADLPDNVDLTTFTTYQNSLGVNIGRATANLNTTKPSRRLLGFHNFQEADIVPAFKRYLRDADFASKSQGEQIAIVRDWKTAISQHPQSGEFADVDYNAIAGAIGGTSRLRPLNFIDEPLFSGGDVPLGTGGLRFPGTGGQIGAAEPLFGGANAGQRNFGTRPDGTQKGTGFLGVLQLSDGGRATEYSTGVQLEALGGEETDIPSLVPTLTQAEIDLMVNDIIPNKKPVPEGITQKAVDHANKRVREGKSVFLESGEQAAQSRGGTPGTQDIPVGRIIVNPETGERRRWDGNKWRVVR